MSKTKLLLAYLLLFSGYAIHAQIRLRASSYYTYNASSQSFIPSDSNRYEYQGQRGSDFTSFYNNYGADKSTRWFYDLGTSQYEESSRGFNNYDNNSNAVLYADFFVNGGVQSDTNTRTEYVYNSNNRVTSRASYRKYSATKWEGLNKISYSYDALGNITETIQEKWDINSVSWLKQFRTVYTRVGNKLTEELGYDWDGSTWDYSTKSTYHYNGNNPDSVLEESYDILSSQWEYSSLSTYTYDANNDNDTLTYLRYNTTLSKWEYSLRYAHSYDNNHNRLSTITQKPVSGIYENDTRQRTIYNTNNLRTHSIMDKWNAVSGQFEFVENGLNGSYQWFWYYEPITADISDISRTQDFTIYPNPASSIIHVQMQLPQDKGLLDFAIYDHSGKVIHYWHEPYSTMYSRNIDVSALPDGIYYLRCSGSAYSKKFIISH